MDAISPMKDTGNSASHACWSHVLPWCGTTSAIIAIAMTATAIQNQIRFGRNMLIPRGEKYSNNGAQRIVLTYFRNLSGSAGIG